MFVILMLEKRAWVSWLPGLFFAWCFVFSNIVHNFVTLTLKL